ncbi:MAG: sodium-dependent transporter [Chlamydiota bacterium]|nr:sodium-dependent transporter [Chlamydiota bacterium]
MQRERWPSKTMFIFAAVGSAVGLGNIWRFPYLVGKYGGGAFLFPYFIMLFLVGFPLLVLEFSLGQKMQQGAVGAMKKIDRKFSGIGLGALMSSFGVACYYAVVMGWALIYSLYSFDLSWGDDTKAFFHQHVLNMSETPNIVGGFSTSVLIALLASWVMVYFCVWKGVKSVSDVVTITMPLPIILLVVLLSRTLFLPGAMDGLTFYLNPNFSALLDIEVWMAAVAQVFFTLSLGFGVMITYASYQDQKSDIIKSALITSIADVAIAFTAGLVIFSTVGYMAQASGESIADLAASGPSLAFIVLPEALSLIPWAPFFAFIFFVTLITLGIDSLFSLIEAIAALFYDHFPNANKKMVVFYICFASVIGGLVFATSAGIYYIDITDHYITVYGLVLTGLLQTLVVGWYYGPEKIREYANEVSDIKIGKSWDFSIKYFIPLALLSIIGKTFYQDFITPYEGYPNWAQLSFGWGLVGTIIIACVAYSIFSNMNKKNSLKP